MSKKVKQVKTNLLEIWLLVGIIFIFAVFGSYFLSQTKVLQAQNDQLTKTLVGLDVQLDAKNSQLTTMHQELDAVKFEYKSLRERVYNTPDQIRLINDGPWQPKLRLSKLQETACLALVIYREERMGTKEDWIKIANVVYNRAGQDRFQQTSCQVINSGWDRTWPFHNVVNQILTGERGIYVPWSARQNKLDGIRWEQILATAKSIVNGKEPYLTEATHFVNIRGLTHIPDWIRKLRPVGTTTGHFLFSDHEIRNGQLVVYTALNPYNQAVFNYSE